MIQNPKPYTAYLSFIFRILIGTLFITAGLAKIADPIRFYSTLMEFRLFPDLLERLLSVYIPWLELLLGLSIATGILYRSSALILFVLNLMFTGAIVSVIARGFEIDCGCFGLLADIFNLPDEADMKAVIRNVIILSMVLFIYVKDETALSMEDYISRRPR